MHDCQGNKRNNEKVAPISHIAKLPSESLSLPENNLLTTLIVSSRVLCLISSQWKLFADDNVEFGAAGACCIYSRFENV